MSSSELKVGFNSHRLKKDDPYHKKECDFVDAINEELKYSSDLLSQVVFSAGKDHLTDHEEKIVLSTIQWLGTPVGQGFLDKVSKM